jgi:hypothetical protein
LNPATGQLIEPEFALGRAAAGRIREPTAAVIDSQSARAVPRASRAKTEVEPVKTAILLIEYQNHFASEGGES